MAKWWKAATRLALIVVTVGAASATYVVERGDTLSGIAVRFGTSVDRLAALNELADPDLILIGQVLETGVGRDGAPVATSGATHVVRVGESLAEIAEDHGVTVDTLVRANGIVNGRVFAGYRLRLTLPELEFVVDHVRRTHHVARGETLSSVAADHAVSTKRLLALNHIDDPDQLAVGANLVVERGWACPVPAGSFSNSWGYVKSDGRTHEGIDIHASRGSAIVAPVAGHLHQETGEIGGLQVTLYGDDGYRYFGSHMESFGASGDVAAGEVIGTVGSSGNAAGTSPHLHFEVHTGDGPSANPYPVLLDACG
jgi:LysM repeat protein